MSDEPTESVTGERTESLAKLLRAVINEGAPIFNEGRADRCYELYTEAAETCIYEPDASTEHRSMLSEAVEQAKEKLVLVDGEYISSSSYKAAAWVLRRCFDKILQELRVTV